MPTVATRGSSSRWFYGGMGVVATLVVLAGFWPSFQGMATGTGSLPPLVKVHGLVFGAWLVLYLVQTTLASTGGIRIHRRLGLGSVALAIAMVILGYMTATAGARRGFDLDGTNDPLGYMVFPLGDILAFAILYVAGYACRRRAEVHKRLMLLLTVGPLLGAPLAHLIAHADPAHLTSPALILPPMLILLFAGAVHDLITVGRIHPVSLWVAALLSAWAILRAIVIGPSGEWHRFAGWLTS